MKNKIDENVISKKLIKLAGICIVLLFIGAIVFSGIFYINLTPVDIKNENEVKFVVQKGWTKTKIASELKKENLIKNEFFFKLYLKLFEDKEFYAGTYLLSPSMDANTIVDTLTETSTIDNESITVTFVEGKKFPFYVKKIANSFNFNEEDIYKLTSDSKYLEELINKYWFITDEILQDGIYYPLEGYLFPDTYSFKKDSTIEEVIAVMLNQMDTKLSLYKDEISLSGKSVHSLLTMASMVELEAVSAEDRLFVASVFYNRLDINMTMGSDVTTYYAVKKEMTDRLTKSDLSSCNAYNTRGTCVKGLPIGPIASPSYSSITAAIEPTESDYLYFVADKKNKVYFSKTSQEQANVISELRKNNMWPE